METQPIYKITKVWIFVKSHFGKMQSDKLKTFSEEKVFNLSELHFSKVNSYKIHTLMSRNQSFQDFFCQFNTDKAATPPLRKQLMLRSHVLFCKIQSKLWYCRSYLLWTPSIQVKVQILPLLKNGSEFYSHISTYKKIGTMF